MFPLIAEFPYNANAYPGHSAGLADRHASFQHRPDGVVSACNRHSLKVCRRAASADGKNQLLCLFIRHPFFEILADFHTGVLVLRKIECGKLLFAHECKDKRAVDQLVFKIMRIAAVLILLR